MPESTLLQTIQDRHQSSGGHCGLTMVELSIRSGVSVEEIKKPLGKLYAEGKIQVRNGLHGKLIFKK